MTETRNYLKLRSIIILSLLVVLSFFYYFFFEFNSLIFDDAFITYRYALNLAAGNGLVYNIGEHVYGTTTLLYAVYLGALSFFTNPGNIHVTSQISSLVFFNSVFFIIFFRYKIDIILLALIYTLMFFNIYVYYSVFSGMETMFVIFLLTFMIIFRERRLFFILVPFFVLARIDVAFALLLSYTLTGLYSVLRNRLQFRKFAIDLLLIFAGAAAAFGLTYLFFGTLVPNTVIAKNVIYRNSAFDQSLSFRFNQLRNFGYPSLVSVPVLILIFYGLINGKRKNYMFKGDMAFLFSFIAVYTMVELLFITRINLWYIPVLTFPVIFFMTLLLNEYGNLKKYFYILLIAACIYNTASNSKIGNVIFAKHNDSVYDSELYKVSALIEPGSKIFCGDIGVIGFYCLKSWIYDYSGLVTPNAIEHNKVKIEYGDKGSSTDYREILAQIEIEKPRYVNFRDYPFYEYIKNDSSFISSYDIVYRGEKENLYRRK